MPTDPPVLDTRAILKRLRELEKRLGKERPLPQAPDELWPGGPSTDMGDMLLARLVRARMGREYLS